MSVEYDFLRFLEDSKNETKPVIEIKFVKKDGKKDGKRLFFGRDDTFCIYFDSNSFPLTEYKGQVIRAKNIIDDINDLSYIMISRLTPDDIMIPF